MSSCWGVCAKEVCVTLMQIVVRLDRNATILDFLKETVPSDDVFQIEKFYKEKKWIVDKIKD